MPNYVIQPPTRGNPETTGVIPLLLEKGEEEAYDRLTRLAAMALRSPAAVLGLMSGARLLVKSQTGMPAPWLSAPYPSLPHAMFRHALATSKPFVIEDIRRHPLTKDMVLGEAWENAAYCGVPIVLSTRRIVGVLAVFDPRPRPWTDREIGFLQDLAASAVQQIEELVVSVTAAEMGGPVPAAFVMQAPDGFLSLDRQGRITGVNARGESILRCASVDLVGQQIAGAFTGVEGTAFQAELARADAEETGVSFEEYCRSLRVWLEVRAFASPGGVAVHFRDVSARREADAALREREARYQSAMQDAPDAIVFTAADGTLIECNRAAVELFGYTREELFHLRLTDLFAEANERERFLLDIVQPGGVSEFAAQLSGKEGKRLECAVTASARRTAEGDVIGMFAIVQDLTERNRTEQQLLHGAFHDVLTGLPNRALFMDRLERMTVQSKRRASYRFAVLFVDLDRFKLVNDTLGHMAGDELLVAVARRLEGCLRAEDTVARFGGDEFAILLDAIQDVRDATRIAERINFELALPFRVGRREVASSASVGIAVSASGYGSGEEILRDADAAMYRAKAGGRARYEVFDTAMHQRAVTHLQLEKDLRRAVEGAEFEVFYQPIVSLDAGTITGLEALLRWRHPERGLLVPDDFMAVAEQTGLIVPIGWSAMREACRQMHTWQESSRAGSAQLTLGINLSARQFHQPDLLPRILEILEETGLEPSCVRLELTEQVVMSDPELSIAMLSELQERGVRITVDDFGTGYSSLQHLPRLPICAVKIDRSFIRGLAADGAGFGHRGVVRTIVALGETLSIEAIAEGVETVEQLQELRTLGARYAQGFLFSHPLDARLTTELLLDRSSS